MVINYTINKRDFRQKIAELNYILKDELKLRNLDINDIKITVNEKGENYYSNQLLCEKEINISNIILNDTKQNKVFNDRIENFLQDQYSLLESVKLMSNFHFVFIYMHELSHAILLNNTIPNNSDLEDFKTKTFLNHDQAFKSYRILPEEAKADKLAVELMNKYAIEIDMLFSSISKEQAIDNYEFWNNI